MKKIAPQITFTTLILLVANFCFASDRPNVLLIVTDDQGYGDMSCHGNPFFKTPNLDRLAAQSANLEDYHVDPVCTPTRAALMTGRYSSRAGAWAVVQGRQLLKRDEVTMANVFADSGYRTGMFGKWHLGDPWPFAPRHRGFQDVLRHLAGGIDEIGNPTANDYFDDTYYRNGLPEKIDGYCTDVFFEECWRFISQESDKPFFAYLPLNAMHSPHTVPAEYSTPFLEKGHSQQQAKFFGQIINFDQQLGILLNKLDQTQRADNTIVIFMGDNGTAQGVVKDDPQNSFDASMRGQKGSVFDGGHRVACFARWPNQFPSGVELQQLTSCRDWLPTLIDLCDLQPSSPIHFDGQNIAPLLTGKTKSWPDRTMFVQRQPDQPRLPRGGNYPHFAVLTEQWRLVNNQLFNIQDDPNQSRDVARNHPEVVATLNQKYQQHFADVFADSVAHERFTVGNAAQNPTLLTVRDWHPTNGRVIWQQPQLVDNALEINGFWAIDVQRAGSYIVRLSRLPRDAPQPMQADLVKLKIGEQEAQQQIDAKDTHATFEMKLPAGPTRVQSWLSGADSGQRGAYFIEFTKKQTP